MLGELRIPADRRGTHRHPYARPRQTNPNVSRASCPRAEACPSTLIEGRDLWTGAGDYAKQSQSVGRANGGHSPPYETVRNKANLHRGRMNANSRSGKRLWGKIRLVRVREQSQFESRSAGESIGCAKQSQLAEVVVCPQGHQVKRLTAPLQTGLAVRNKANSRTRPGRDALDAWGGRL